MVLKVMDLARVFFISLTLCVVSSCTGFQEGETVTVDVDKGISDPVSVFEFFDEVSVSALEQADKISYSVYNGPSCIACCDNKLFLLDEWNRLIYVYGLDGSLLEVVNHLGRGPGEFAMASSIRPGHSEESIAVLDPSCRILHYSTSKGMPYVSEDNYRQTFSSINDFVLTDSGNYVLFSISEETPFSVSKSGSFSTKQSSYRPQPWLYRYQYPNPPLFKVSEKTCFFEPDNGTIYTINSATSKCSVLYNLDLGKYTCKSADIPKEGNVEEYGDFIRQFSFRKVSPFLRMLGCQNFIFVTAVFQNDVCTLVIDTDTNETCFIKKTKEGMKLMPGVYYKGCVFSIVDSPYINDYITNAILDERSISEVNKAKEEDSAILIKYKLK